MFHNGKGNSGKATGFLTPYSVEQKKHKLDLKQKGKQVCNKVADKVEKVTHTVADSAKDTLKTVNKRTSGFFHQVTNPVQSAAAQVNTVVSDYMQLAEDGLKSFTNNLAFLGNMNLRMMA